VHAKESKKIHDKRVETGLKIASRRRSKDKLLAELLSKGGVNEEILHELQEQLGIQDDQSTGS
jgi:hypothetical protein